MPRTEGAEAGAVGAGVTLGEGGAPNPETRFGGTDELKRKWLESWGLRPDKSVIDCDPTAQQVQLEDGSIHQLCQVYQRVMGYFQPVNMWNIGKRSEYRERKTFREPGLSSPCPRHADGEPPEAPAVAPGVAASCGAEPYPGFQALGDHPSLPGAPA